MGLSDKLKALLGISSYEYRRPSTSIDEDAVDRIRESLGGNISPMPTTTTRWYLSDVETAERCADVGDVSMAARLCRAMAKDGTLSGLLSTRTDGLVRLPKRFFGDETQVFELSDSNGTRSIFDEICPPSELALMAADGILLGISVGELLPVEGRDYPVLVRHDPEWLRYRWAEGRWYYNSVAGPLPIQPGDGRWVFHVPGGRIAPWQRGLWKALSRAWISKEHAIFSRANYAAKLANPARVAKCPQGSTLTERRGFHEDLIRWGLNTVIELLPGWEVDLLESNGRGYEVFQQEIDTADKEIMVALAGQIVTTTGGTGFANADIHQSIRADLIKSTADALAYTVNTQILPSWVITRWGAGALQSRARVFWDAVPPKNQSDEAQSLNAAAMAIASLDTALKPHGKGIDIISLCQKFAIPIVDSSLDRGLSEQEEPKPVESHGTSDVPAGDQEEASKDIEAA